MFENKVPRLISALLTGLFLLLMSRLFPLYGLDPSKRINSMALVHQKLYTSDDLSRIDFSDYIRDLASTIMKSYSIDPN